MNTEDICPMEWRTSLLTFIFVTIIVVVSCDTESLIIPPDRTDPVRRFLIFKAIIKIIYVTLWLLWHQKLPIQCLTTKTKNALELCQSVEFLTNQLNF